MTLYNFAIPVFLGLILLSTPITMTDAFAQQPPNEKIDPKEKKEKDKKDTNLKISKSPENLVDKVQKKGKVRVIVELNTDFDPKIPKEKKMKQKADIKAAQKSLMDTLSLDGISSFHNFKETPQIAMTVNDVSLDELISSSMVKSVIEDRLHIQHLDLSVPTGTIGTVNADTLYGLGLDGSGQTVAVIDTGVDKTHNFFNGGSRVVSEACFTSIPTLDQASNYGLCPNDSVADTSVNSGLPCSIEIDSVIITVSDCDHGTHVAGIAAGAKTSGVGPTSGVAKGADIISIQAFTIFEGTDDDHICSGGTPEEPVYCALAYTSDIILSLQHVLALHGGLDGFTKDIASVNMSLGGGAYGAVCDLIPSGFINIPPVTHPMKPSIDALRTAGIATIVSAGNIGSTNEVMTSPACISSAISVSSTDDSNTFPLKAAQASFLDFLAPGGNSGAGGLTADSGIKSSVPGNTFGVKTGTSMAAPHVSGAWAILSAANATASFDEKLSALKDTGIQLPLRNPSHGIKPLIQIDKALAAVITNLCYKNISDFNIIFGTNGDDNISGTANADLIIGFDGDDRIRGLGGDDCLIGGNGDDKLSGGDGDDYLQGNADADHLTGRNHADKLFGGDGNDVLSGGDGADTLDGGNGIDVLFGRTGVDSLSGGDGTDICKGGGQTETESNAITCEFIT